MGVLYTVGNCYVEGGVCHSGNLIRFVCKLLRDGEELNKRLDCFRIKEEILSKAHVTRSTETNIGMAHVSVMIRIKSKPSFACRRFIFRLASR